MLSNVIAESCVRCEWRNTGDIGAGRMSRRFRHLARNGRHSAVLSLCGRFCAMPITFSPTTGAVQS